ncbi:hypothetical protein HYH02_004828 [Chlamydomonas schloesseri]|uniref:AAA+ ATPase domain-containing protein n=1 Tax=Chlamydomonas schloesseri TaxID=2026947 RepID=A0A836B860_9CHLO|nr:hypothetical protein HYH02_004828 [Chlamydomonas schloesseri]|eukprot:KAG2450323.1 hypothetical protein HYH02_004828 [Chlamydomonas schloesseri]
MSRLLRPRGLLLCAHQSLSSQNFGSLAAAARRAQQEAVRTGSDAAGVLDAYQRLLDAGTLWPDASQRAAAKALQLLQDAVLRREAALVSGDFHLGAGGPLSQRPETEPPAVGAGAAGGALQQPATAAASAGASAGASLGPLGVYLWGPVGSGKTALMDLFHRTTRARLQQLQQQQAQQPGLRTEVGGGGRGGEEGAGPGPGTARDARRVHFHEFMQGVHGRLHQLQLARPKVVARSRQGLLVYRYAEPEEDPLVTVAREVAGGSAVLCLDELHVTDVADAMILARLFGCLLDGAGAAGGPMGSGGAGGQAAVGGGGSSGGGSDRGGCALVFTSNRRPSDLYRGGLSRQYFVPFVQLVDSRLAVANVAADVDYRRATAAAAAAATGLPAGAGTGTGGNGSSQAAAPSAEQQAQQSDEPIVVGSLPLGDWSVGPGAADALRSAWQRRLEAAGKRGANGGGASRTIRGASEGGISSSSSSSASDSARRGEMDDDTGNSSIAEVPLAYGRWLKVPNTCGSAAFFSFEQLCGAAGLKAGMDDGGALAAPDFLALCRHFNELYITDVPQLGLAQRDEARRLVTLLDVAYDMRCRLLVSAAVPPDELFAPLLAEAKRLGVNPRLGLGSASSQHRSAPASNKHPAAHHSRAPPTPAAAAAATVASNAPVTNDDASSEQGSVPAASITAALHSSGSLTGGLPPRGGITNTVNPSEFTGSSASSGGGGAAPVRPGDLVVPKAVWAEEVLMYHRAVSRLTEMCRLVDTR